MERLRINIPLNSDEFVALRQSAELQLRHPRDQARYLLRQALGLCDFDAAVIDGQARHIDQMGQRRAAYAEQ